MAGWLGGPLGGRQRTDRLAGRRRPLISLGSISRLAPTSVISNLAALLNGRQLSLLLLRAALMLTDGAGDWWTWEASDLVAS